MIVFMGNRKEKNQGMNWIRPEKRLAIYLRDGLACCYCNRSVEQGAKLTLDHLRAYSHNGSNEATNLVTACHCCNSSRGNRSWKKFAEAAAQYSSAKLSTVVDHIQKTRRRVIDVPAAKEIMTQRGGFTAALSN